MSREPENPVLVDLSRFDHRLEWLGENVRSLKCKMTQTGGGVAKLSVSHAGLQQRMDHLDNPLDRIERRLTLHEAAR